MWKLYFCSYFQITSNNSCASLFTNSNFFLSFDQRFKTAVNIFAFQCAQTTYKINLCYLKSLIHYENKILLVSSSILMTTFLFNKTMHCFSLTWFIDRKQKLFSLILWMLMGFEILEPSRSYFFKNIFYQSLSPLYEGVLMKYFSQKSCCAPLFPQ